MRKVLKNSTNYRKKNFHAKKTSNLTFPMANNTKDIDFRLLMHEASGQCITSMYSNLGPVVSYSDLLINDQNNPIKVLAAEHIIHMIEALRYFSSAIYAYMNNEGYHAIHMAYYAELRAVLSLYAGSGIRTEKIDLPHEHPYFISKDGRKHFYARFVETHRFASMAWNEWILRSDAQELLWDSIYLRPGVSLRCFKTYLALANPQLLQSWGFDLVQIEKDRAERNSVSYQAYWRYRSFTKMDCTHVKFARELVKLFIRSESGLFFDKVLVQYLVNDIIRSMVDGNDGPEDINTKFNNKRDELIREVSRCSGVEEDSLRVYLENETAATLDIFDKAKEQSVCIENILARTAFLARLAMLSVNKNITFSGNQHIKSWIRNWLEHCGCWEPTTDEEIDDLETDFREAIDEFSHNNFTNVPSDLWNSNNVYNTLKIVNPHLCIAWGLSL